MSLFFFELVIITSVLIKPALEYLILTLECGVLSVSGEQLLRLTSQILIQYADLVLHVSVLLKELCVIMMYFLEFFLEFYELLVKSLIVVFDGGDAISLVLNTGLVLLKL